MLFFWRLFLIHYCFLSPQLLLFPFLLLLRIFLLFSAVSFSIVKVFAYYCHGTVIDRVKMFRCKYIISIETENHFRLNTVARIESRQRKRKILLRKEFKWETENITPEFHRWIGVVCFMTAIVTCTPFSLVFLSFWIKFQCDKCPQNTFGTKGRSYIVSITHLHIKCCAFQAFL